MKWKYFKRALLLLLVIAIAIPAYRYCGSIDWSKNHSTRIASLPVLTENDNTGEFRIQVGEMEYLVRAAGLQNDGPAVILLHGFPESSIMWDGMLEHGAANGYRVVAFDQRGYSPGARPSGSSNYQIDHLTQDVIAVADKMGFEKFHLVGHDWGAVVSWKVAMDFPKRLLSLSALSIPHIGVFFDAVVNHPEQHKRSGYFKRLQTPILPEYKFVANDLAFYKQMMGKNPQKYLDEYVALFAEHGAATAALNWYRAMDVEEMASDSSFRKTIDCPTLFIWGTEDGVIAPAIIPEQKEYIKAPYKEVSLETGHGLIQSKPDTVISELLAHFKSVNVSLDEAPNSIIGINSISIVVNDLEKMTSFYRSATGFEILKREKKGGEAVDKLFGSKGSSYESVTFQANTLLFELIQFDKQLEEPIKKMYPKGPGMTHTCFQSPTWDSGYHRFKQQGATVHSRGDSPVDLGGYGVWYAYAHDPEGNMFELEVLDTTSLNRDGYDENWINEKDMWMTQVALISPDLDRIVNYYQRILEFGPQREREIANNDKMDDIMNADNVKVKASWIVIDGHRKMMELMEFVNPVSPKLTGKKPINSTGYSFSFEVGNLKMEYERLKAIGVDFISEPQLVGEFWIVYAHDIDGNLFSLRQVQDPNSKYSLKNFYRK